MVSYENLYQRKRVRAVGGDVAGAGCAAGVAGAALTSRQRLAGLAEHGVERRVQVARAPAFTPV